MNTWLTILGMAIVTYAARAPALLALRGELAPWLRRWLGYVPIAVFTALIVPALLVREQGDTRVLVFGPALPAGIVGALAAWWSGSVLATIAAGMLTFWALRWAGF